MAEQALVTVELCLAANWNECGDLIHTRMLWPPRVGETVELAQRSPPNLFRVADVRHLPASPAGGPARAARPAGAERGSAPALTDPGGGDVGCPRMDAAALADLRARWLALTQEILPALAAARGWPVRADHCFQRILLDNACGGRWYDQIAGRPAYLHADPALLARAVALGEAAAAGEADLHALNARSLAWRRAARA